MTTFARGLVAAEILKLSTTRAARWVLAAGGLLVALAMSGAIASGGVPLASLGTDDGLRTVMEHGGLPAILPLILGVLMTAGEYRHGTVVDTFLSEPRRARAVLAQLTAGALVGLASGVVCAVVAAVTAALWYAAKDVPLSLGSPLVVRSLVGIVAWQALYTVIGVAVGAIVRAQATAMVAAIAWIFIVETAIAGLVVSLGRWLPATA
ncbi:MAG: hypothetical protein HHJ10_08055, partial [Cellulomonas sp.]|uniref:ABC transporter permease subunit n=1 Tax=Cellulomonas sp. TaxID=40001 RepID=UPI001812D0FD